MPQLLNATTIVGGLTTDSLASSGDAIVSGRLGVGIAPAYALDIYTTSPGNAGGVGINALSDADITANASGIYYGFTATVQSPPNAYTISSLRGFYALSNFRGTKAAASGTQLTTLFGASVLAYIDPASTGDVNTITGMQAKAEHAGDGSVAQMYGLNLTAQIDATGGPVALMQAMFVQNLNSSTSTIGTSYAVRVHVPGGTGPITTHYGVYVANQGRANITANYGIYVDNQSGGGGNYALYTNNGPVRFGDNVTIVGTIAAANYSGSVSGGGAIVTAGFTLTVPATGIAALRGAANVFTTVQTVPNLQIDGAAGTGRNLIWMTGGSNRWILQATTGAENGSNVGSNLLLQARADDGSTVIGTAFQIIRSSMAVTFAGAITAANYSGSVSGGGAIVTGGFTLTVPATGTAVISTDSRLSDSRPPTGTATGDLSGSYPAPTVAGIRGAGVTITALASGHFLRYSGTAWVNTALVAGDIPALAYVPASQVTGGGIVATGGFTLTVPASGVAALLARANAFSAIQSFAGTVVLNGGQQRGYVTKTANYTITDTDDVIAGDATGGAITLTLPSAVGRAGRIYTVRRLNSGSNAVSVATVSSQTILGGASPAIINIAGQGLTMMSDGANWVYAYQ